MWSDEQTETETDRHKQRERQTDLQTDITQLLVFSHFFKALKIENPIVTFGRLCY